jgi:hypothetical protein
MTTIGNRPHFDIDKDISFEMVRDGNSCYVSIYNDRNDSCVAFSTNSKCLKGLADFLYDTIGEKK